MTNGANAGKIAIVPKGDYNRATAYEKLNLVSHNGKSWVAKKPSIGIEPSKYHSEYWHEMAGHTAVNNLTCTEAGYVLDARQGKILMDAINETNSNLEAEISERESAVAEAMEQIAQIANNQIPQEYLESAVDAYVTENSGGFATRDALDTVEADLKSDLIQMESELNNSIENIIPFNIKGVSVTGNMIPLCVQETKEGYYCLPRNGGVVFGGNAKYTSYKILIDELTTYYFAYEWIVICDEEGNALNSEIITTGSVDLAEYPTAKYVWYACTADNTYFSKNADVSFVSVNFVENEAVKYQKYSGVYTGETVLSNLGNSLQKNLIVSASGVIKGTFDTVCVSFRKSNGGDENIKVTVDDTNVIVWEEMYGSPRTRAFEHGLDIKNNIQIYLKFTGKNALILEVVSNGVKYSTEIVGILKRFTCRPVLVATNNCLESVDFTWTCEDLDKNIWAFGDSYFAYSTTRWVKHLYDSGYADNVLINSFAGENSTEAIADLTSLIQMGSPKYLFWCLGMNDGSDSDNNTPSTTWMNGINKMLAFCKTRSITPILATIPSVPTVYNEGKNNWVRNSGYQYVDFAKAVGATSDGAWYDGMLSDDGVHPDEQGGMALYYQVLSDFPQIMISN